MFARQRENDVFNRRIPMRRKRPVIRFVLLMLGVVLAGVLLTLAYLGVRPPYLFFPDTVVSYHPHDLRPPLAFEEVSFTTLDQVEVSAWWVPSDSVDIAPTLLFFHGSVGDLGDRLAWIKLAHGAGFNVLAVDYRGYGASGGVPSVGGLYRDADAAYDWLVTDRGIAPEDLIIVGHSMGAAVAAQLAERRASALVVLESAFPSMGVVGKTLVARQTGRELPGALVRVLYWNANLNTLGRVGDIDAPVLVIHSRDDQLVPFEYAEMLAEAAGEDGMLSEVRGPHGFVLDATGEAYFVPIRAAYEASRRGF